MKTPTFNTNFPLFWTSFLLGISITCTTALVCPLEERIAPCACLLVQPEEDVQIRCDGPLITQTSIDKVFCELRTANNFSSTQSPLSLNAFSIWHTDLEELDVTSFLRSRITLLTIFANARLRSFVIPPLKKNGTNLPQIDVQNLILTETSLEDSGFGDFLSYFTTNLTTITLSENLITGEFITALRAFPNLQGLTAQKNRIQRLASGALSITGRLELVDLAQNEITEIEENAFFFVNESKSSNDQYLVVALSGNKNLTEVGIHPNSGISLAQGQTKIYLVLADCSLSSLPREIFEPFLDGNVGNLLFVGENPLVCNDRVKWAKDRRVDLEHRIDSPFCINDPGQTIFNSSFVQ